jgi:hypothetical protein
MGGFGLYVDHASGLHVYRNIAYNNAHYAYMFTGTWQDGDMVYYNNVAANSLHGFRLWGEDTHGHVNTRLINNIIVNSEGYGVSLSSASGDYGNLTVDHNLYYGNGWRPAAEGGVWQAGALEIVQWSAANQYYRTLADIQSHTSWEAHGEAGDPRFWQYDPNDHDLHDGSRPDFHLTAASTNAIDKGAAALPTSLVALLDTFEVRDPLGGDRYDIGRYERGFAVLCSPSIQPMEPGGTIHYTLGLYPPDLPHAVTLTVTNPSPDLVVTLSSNRIAPGTPATLTVSNVGSPLTPGALLTIPITGTGAGFTHGTHVRLAIYVEKVYLPLIQRGHR